MDDAKQLQSKLARLESANDHLSTEMNRVNELLKKVGFQDGLDTLKQAVYDLEALEGDDVDKE